MFNDHLYFYLLNKHPSLRNLRERERETERETGRERQRETERGRDRPVFLCPKQTQQAQKPHLATISLTSLSRQNRERERERERERDRQTDRQTDRDRERQRETERGRDRPVFLCPKQTPQAQKPHLPSLYHLSNIPE